MLPDQVSLYVSPPQLFENKFNEARYVVLGVPFDTTSTYRPGSRFGPSAIREASLNLETYSIRTEFDLEDIPVCDIGDLHVVDNVEETLRRLSLVTEEILGASKTPIILGGEHTITFGTVRSFPKETGVLCLDAHADMRDEYMGQRIMHATFLRRIIDLAGVENVVHVGLRALCKEELAFIKANDVKTFPTHDLRRQPVGEAARLVREAVSQFRKLYVTIDIDVLDPAFAPGVGNPEPDGMSPDLCLSILAKVCDKRLAGLDLVEVSPHYDTGITAAVAAKALFEAMCAAEAERTKGEPK